MEALGNWPSWPTLITSTEFSVRCPSSLLNHNVVTLCYDDLQAFISPFFVGWFLIGVYHILLYRQLRQRKFFSVNRESGHCAHKSGRQDALFELLIATVRA